MQVINSCNTISFPNQLHQSYTILSSISMTFMMNLNTKSYHCDCLCIKIKILINGRSLFLCLTVLGQHGAQFTDDAHFPLSELYEIDAKLYRALSLAHALTER
eukprot:696260_1